MEDTLPAAAAAQPNPPPTWDFEFGCEAPGEGGSPWGERTWFDETGSSFDLTQMSLGMWRARSHNGIRFLLGRYRFVFVVFRKRRASTFSRASELVNSLVTSKVGGMIRVPTSPFQLDQTRTPGRAGGFARTPSHDPSGPGPSRLGATDAATPPAAGSDTAVDAAQLYTFSAGAGHVTPGFDPHASSRHPSHTQSPPNLVLTFEVKVEDIVGMDYRNPLCEDGRIALEVRRVAKRAFPSFATAAAYFNERDAQDARRELAARSAAAAAAGAGVTPTGVDGRGTKRTLFDGLADDDSPRFALSNRRSTARLRAHRQRSLQRSGGWGGGSAGGGWRAARRCARSGGSGVMSASGAVRCTGSSRRGAGGAGREGAAAAVNHRDDGAGGGGRTGGANGGEGAETGSRKRSRTLLEPRFAAVAGTEMETEARRGPTEALLFAQRDAADRGHGKEHAGEERACDGAAGEVESDDRAGVVVDADEKDPPEHEGRMRLEKTTAADTNDARGRADEDDAIDDVATAASAAARVDAKASSPGVPPVRTVSSPPTLVEPAARAFSPLLTPGTAGREGGVFQHLTGGPGPTMLFTHRTVVVHFDDPHLPDALRLHVEGRQRLLQLYESGLPSWALFLATYGFYYRPYMRTVSRYLFVLVSVLSMMAGFYDLYKHVPGVNAIIASMWAPFIEFLEQHTSIRLSILASYLFTQSAIFAPLMAQLSVVARLMRSATAALWRPIAAVFGGVWRDIAAVCSIGFSAVSITLRALWGFTSLVLGPGVRLLGAIAGPLTGFAPVIEGVFAGIIGPLSGIVGAGRTAVKAASVGKVAMDSVGRAGGASGMARISLGLSWLDLRLWRDMGLTVFRATQRIVNFLVYICVKVNAHRLSLGMATRRTWRRALRRASQLAPDWVLESVHPGERGDGGGGSPGGSPERSSEFIGGTKPVGRKSVTPAGGVLERRRSTGSFGTGEATRSSSSGRERRTGVGEGESGGDGNGDRERLHEKDKAG